jgi:hypothetical protein
MAITVGHQISVIELWENTHPSICFSLNLWVNHTIHWLIICASIEIAMLAYFGQMHLLLPHKGGSGWISPNFNSD